jgi:hypothetical protein
MPVGEGFQKDWAGRQQGCVIARWRTVTCGRAICFIAHAVKGGCGCATWGGAHHGTDGNDGRISEGGAWLIRPLFFCPSGGRTSAGMAVTQSGRAVAGPRAVRRATVCLELLPGHPSGWMTPCRELPIRFPARPLLRRHSSSGWQGVLSDPGRDPLQSVQPDGRPSLLRNPGQVPAAQLGTLGSR